VPNSNAIARCGLRRKTSEIKNARRWSLRSKMYEIVNSAKVRSLNARKEKKIINGLAINAKCHNFSDRPFDNKILFEVK
jgi:hypothetical protein